LPASADINFFTIQHLRRISDATEMLFAETVLSHDFVNTQYFKKVPRAHGTRRQPRSMMLATMRSCGRSSETLYMR
jgi:hypothetical protein